MKLRWKTNIIATNPNGKVDLTTKVGDEEQNVTEENVDCLLQAAGREGNLSTIGLEKMGIKIGRGNFIEIDKNTLQVKAVDSIEGSAEETPDQKEIRNQLGITE